MASMWIAVVAAIAAGAAFAASSILQQRVAAGAPGPRDERLRVSLLTRLARQPLWLLGFGCAGVGFVLQAIALAFGTITLVQPLIVSELLFALPVAVWLGRRRMGHVEWTGTAAIVGGLALFLAVASPSEPSRPSPANAVWVLVGAAAVGFAALCVLGSRLLARPRRATLLGMAAGVLFGLQSSLLKTVTYLFATHGYVDTMVSWQPYALGAVAIAGLVCNQTAFQLGPLPQSLPAIDVGEPVVAVAIAVSAFGEQVAHSPEALALEFTGVAMALIGMVLLDRSPAILGLHQPRPPARPPPPGDNGRPRTARVPA
jgi:drug/metabolite transporter (DMT)-like permease